MKFILALGLALLGSAAAQAGTYYDLHQNASSVTLSIGGNITVGSVTSKTAVNIDGATGQITTSSNVVVGGPNPWVDVRAYGAKVDGTTDDTAALLAAEAALPTAGGATGGGTIYIPAGTMRIHCWQPTHHGLVVRGAGMTATRIQGLGCGTAMIRLKDISYGRMENIALDANNLSTTTLALESTSSMSNWTFENMYVVGATSYTIAFDPDEGLSKEVSKITFDKVYILSSSNTLVGNIFCQGSNTQQITFKNGLIWGAGVNSGSVAVDMRNGQLNFIDVDFNLNSTDVYKTGGQITVYGGHAEGPTFWLDFASDPQPIASAVDVVEGFQGSSSGSNWMIHHNSRGIVLIGDFFGGNVVADAGIIFGAGNVFSSGKDYSISGAAKLGGLPELNGAYPNILLANGIVISSGAAVVTGTGASFGVLGSTFSVANSGIITAASQPGGRWYRSATQNLGNAATTPTYFDTTDWAVGGFNLVASSSGTITVPAGAGGVYSVVCGWEMPGGVNGNTLFNLVQNATVKAKAALNATATDLAWTASDILNLAAGDTIACKTTVFNAGLSLAGAADQATFLALQKLW